jgi:hypothetical protein
LNKRTFPPDHTVTARTSARIEATFTRQQPGNAPDISKGLTEPNRSRGRYDI